MIHALAEDGLAAVTTDTDDCFDCGGRYAKWLTREEAIEAAQELLELAPMLMTKEEVEACAGIDAIGMWLYPELKWSATIPGFMGPFDRVPYAVAAVEFKP